MFKDRTAAGQALAEKISRLVLHEPVLLALPRGGVVVAAPIAQRLNIPINVLVVRKVGHPANPETAIGAVMPDGRAVLDRQMIDNLKISEQLLSRLIHQETEEIKRRLVLYAGSSEQPEITGKTAIVIDDGIATGYTVKAALKWLQNQKPAKLILAVPVAPPDVMAELRQYVDHAVCLLEPDPFYAVGMFYENFDQTTDEEVLSILQSSKRLPIS